MSEGKESFWRKKGFYLSVCTALICLLAVGTVYYKMNYKNADNGKNLFADASTPTPEVTIKAAGNSAVSADTNKTKAVKKTVNVRKNTKVADADNQKQKTVNQKQIKVNDKKVKNKEDKKNKTEKKTAVAAMSGSGSKEIFNQDKGLLWPVSGDVILKYSMTNTVYFKTLEQYKCNPAIAIASEVGTKVKAAADGTVTKVEKKDDIGNIVTMDIGSNYTVTYGQLKDVAVKEGQVLKEGEAIGKIASPTKYYSEEGSNLYMQVKENGKSVDPLLLLR